MAIALLRLIGCDLCDCDVTYGAPVTLLARNALDFNLWLTLDSAPKTTTDLSTAGETGATLRLQVLRGATTVNVETPGAERVHEA